MAEQAAPHPPSLRTLRGKLFLVSALSLLIELILIRWVPATIHVVGFFANLVLIAAFLGLGLGVARRTPVPEASWRAFFRTGVCVAIVAAIGLADVGASIPPGADQELNEVAVRVGISLPLPVLLIAIFALLVWTTIPYGQLVGGFFDALPRIEAYSINIAGSLTGVGLFSLLAWLEQPPVIWFLALLVMLWSAEPRRAALTPTLLVLLTVIALHIDDSDGLSNPVAWSPYYKVLTTPIVPSGSPDQGFVTDVNGQFLLSGFDLRPDARLPASVPVPIANDVEELKTYYDFPFAIAKADRVLVLGAGAGNDVAAAARNGVRSITAVEIDPAVLRLGREHHPERPFASPHVRAVLGDARAFLDRDRGRYDLIIFATLDAHGLLSGVSSVRLDSFIYTLRSLEAAKDRLTEDGVLVLSFGPFREDVQYRQFAMMRSVFGRDPLWFVHSNNHRTLVAGDLERVDVDPLPAGWRRVASDEIAAGLAKYPHALTPATDDWPHLYTRTKGIPREYLGVLAGIVLIAVASVRRGFKGRRFNSHFFFLGAGFLLLETKSVTEYALIVGSTWQTNSLVFIVILSMILIANLLVLRVLERVHLPLVYGLLVASLIAGYAWPIARFAGEPGPLRAAIAAGYLGVPIFLAAIVFASTFRHALSGTAALASNLVGAVFGGVVEYLSLAWGIRSLSLVAAAMYVLSFAAWSLGRDGAAEGAPEIARA